MTRPILEQELDRMRAALLEPATVRGIRRIEDLVKDLWANAPRPLPYVPHDETHNQRVERLVYRLLGHETPPTKKAAAQTIKVLGDQGLFLLLAGVWLHDVGMRPDLLSSDQRPVGLEATYSWHRQVRHDHHERSASWVSRHRTDLGLGEYQSLIVQNLCRWHRFDSYFDMHEAEDYDRRTGVKQKLLGALLRLADCLHIPDRQSERDFAVYAALGLDGLSRFHWLKSDYVQNVEFDREAHSIRLLIRLPLGWKEPLLKPLQRALEHMVRDELDCVKDILAREDLPRFFEVETPCETDTDLTPRETEELRQVLRIIDLFYPGWSLSAGEVADAVLEQLILLTRERDAARALALLSDYRLNILANLLRDRPCHVFLKKTDDMLSRALKKGQANAAGVAGIATQIQQWMDRRAAALDAIPSRAAGVLNTAEAILLYGYSYTVVRCLAAMPAALKRTKRIYIAEAATKCEHRFNNRQSYSDGLRYLGELKGRGLRNLRLVPDAAASNLFSRGLVGSVVFGANGIDGVTGEFAHALGHLAIADMAKQYRDKGVSVYVVADSMKIGRLREQGDLQRRNKWYPTDIQYAKLLDPEETYNPREDVVPSDRITQVITEGGVFRPRQLRASTAAAAS